MRKPTMPRSPSDWRLLVGGMALAAALLAVVALPPGWIPITLALVAAYGLAATPRLGWLGAGLLVALAIPYGRGADIEPLQLAGAPVRPQDGVLALALSGAFVSRQMRLRSRDPYVMAIVAWLGIGIVALGVGLLSGHELRDVLRDARWWGLYVVGAIAVMGAAPRDQIVRGLLIGATVLAVLVVVATLLPAFDGGLKAGALSYDRGTLRMQFGNSAFLLAATAYVTWSTLVRPSRVALGWLGLLLVGQMLSLTRISLITTAIVVGLVVVMSFWDRRHVRPEAVRRLGAVGLTIMAAFVIGLGLNSFGVLVASPGSGPDGENPIGRITFTDEQSDISSIVNSVGSGGRFATYLNAFNEVRESPVVGRGLGALIDVPFAYNADRAHTIGKQPGVDNAYLTAALKGGVIAALALGVVILLPLIAALRQRSLRQWFVPAWLGLGALTMTQSFAVSSYGPFALALVGSIPFLGYAVRSVAAARDHEYMP